MLHCCTRSNNTNKQLTLWSATYEGFVTKRTSDRMVATATEIAPQSLKSLILPFAKYPKQS